MLYGIILGIYVSNSITDFLLILLFAFLGMIIFCSCITIIRLLAIYLGDVENIAHVYEYNLLITFTTYPEQIFGRVVKFLMYTIVPAGYMVHLPIRIIYEFNIANVGIIILVATIFAIVANLLFKIVLKKYESGNNIALRG